MRVALVASHPIQHFCPQYVSFAKNKHIQLKVFFASALGYKKYVDPLFKKEISWSNLGLEHFDHVFLNGEEALPADKHLDAPSLNQELDAFKPDVVITYGYFPPMQKRAKEWANKNNITVAYISDTERRQRRPILKELLKFPVVYNYFKGIDYFLSVGDANEAYYKFHGVQNKKIIRMHFPIDIREYEPAYQQRETLRKTLRQQYQIPDAMPVLCVAGKLVESKKQQDIIAAMQLLEQRGVIVHLLIAGSGETLPMLQQMAAQLKESKVTFAGFIPPQQLPSFYAATDIYIHPSSRDAHSLAISEAIYMGCPVICSDRCGSWGPDDDVQPGFNGFVFNCGNTSQLADLIHKLIIAPGMLVEFGERSHKLSLQYQQRSHYTAINELSQQVGKAKKSGN